MEYLSQMLDQKSPRFNTISRHHLLTDALHRMCSENAEYLIVLEDEQFVGLLTEHDITHKILYADKPLAQLKVDEIMNRKLPVANSSDSVEYAMQLLDRYNTRYMAIYDGFQFRGIVSENDLLKSVINQQKQSTKQTGYRDYSWNH